MAFTAAEIKNLALQEINHETISNWSDSSNTDIPIINSQYNLAKSVALTMYQWSWAFKYTPMTMFEYVFYVPQTWSQIGVYTDSSKTEFVSPVHIDAAGKRVFANVNRVYVVYTVSGSEISQYLNGVPTKYIVGKYSRCRTLPTDFAGYLACYTDEKMTMLADYVVINNVVYSDSDKLYIKYISTVDESVFPPEFVDWFKIFLAQRINGYLNGDMQRQQLLNSEEPFYFRKAKNIDSKRNKHDSLSGNPFLWIRGKLGGGI